MNWDERISRAEKIGNFTDDDKYEASNFKTCAVGEAAPDSWREPGIFRDLGFAFYDAVFLDDTPAARQTWNVIQVEKRLIQAGKEV